MSSNLYAFSFVCYFIQVFKVLEVGIHPIYILLSLLMNSIGISMRVKISWMSSYFVSLQCYCRFILFVKCNYHSITDNLSYHVSRDIEHRQFGSKTLSYT